MKCCVRNCSNRENTKIDNPSSHRITFHTFPKDPKQRDAWIESLAIPNWLPSNNTVICSDHFKEKEISESKQGIRKVKNGAVPVIKGVHSLPVSMRVCKICLCLDAKMYNIKDYNLYEMYQNILGIWPRLDDWLPQNICWQCAARLNAAESFRTKALLADAVLEGKSLNLSDILRIQKTYKTFKTTLTKQKAFNNDLLDDQKPNSEVNAETVEMPHNDEVEVEMNTLVEKIIFNDEENESDEEYSNLGQDAVKTEVDLIPNIDVGTANSEVEVTPQETDYFVFNDISFPDNDDSGTENDKEDEINDDFILSADEKRLQNNVVIKIDDSDNSGKNKKNISKRNILAKGLNKPVVCVEKMRTSKVDEIEKKNSVKRRKEIEYEKDEDGRVIKIRKRKFRPSMPVDENVFTITPLNQDDLVQEVLKRKDSARFKNAPYKCNVCYVGFPTEDKQTRHAIKHSEKSGPFKCFICKFRMKLSLKLRKHMRSVHSTEYSCKLCPLVTRSKTVALGHVKFHAGKKYECPQCLVTFEKYTTLLNHKRLKHISDCVCELCGHTFVSQKGVRVHKIMRHRIAERNAELEGPYCEVCDIKFLSQKAYDKHLRLSSKHIKDEDDPNRLSNRPSNDPSIKSRSINRVYRPALRRPRIRRRGKTTANCGPILCEQCGLELENPRVYVSHFRSVHQGMNRSQYFASQYMCEQCGKLFMSRTFLEGHMWVHTGQKRFECDHCHKSFSMKSNLAIHMQQHLSTQRSYPCRICGKLLLSSYNLSRHMFSSCLLAYHMQQHESTRRSYPCRICGKLFGFSYNLTRHMFRHTGLRPFQCNACEKNFPTKEQLRAHIDHVHLKKPRPKRIRRRTKKCDLPSLEY